MQLYLANQFALVRRADGTRVLARAPTWQLALSEVAKGLAERPRRGSLRVLLSAGLLRPFVFSAVDGVETHAEALQLATAMAPEATGLTPPCLSWIERYEPGRASFGAAIEQSLFDALGAFAAAAGLRLRSVRPWWDETLGRARSTTPGVLALEDSDALMLLTRSNDNGEEVYCYAPPPGLLQREATISRLAQRTGASPAARRHAFWTPVESNEKGATQVGNVAWSGSQTQ